MTYVITGYDSWYFIVTMCDASQNIPQPYGPKKRKIEKLAEPKPKPVTISCLIRGVELATKHRDVELAIWSKRPFWSRRLLWSKWPCMARHGHIWPSMARHGHAWPCMAIYGHPWPCMAMHGHAWPDMALYGHIWPCMAIISSKSHPKSQKSDKMGKISKSKFSLGA